jgi:outer membrane biosynthesis protein TonB
MAREIPVLVRAAAGLAATVLDEARKLPETLPGLPVRVIGLAMQHAMRIQQHYAGFVARGDELFTGLRGEDEPGLATFDDDVPVPATGFRDSAFDRAGDSLPSDSLSEEDFADLLDDPEADAVVAEGEAVAEQVEKARQTIEITAEEAPSTEEVLEEVLDVLAIEDMVADAPESAPAKKTAPKKAPARKTAAKKAAVPVADATLAEAAVPAPAPEPAPAPTAAPAATPAPTKQTAEPAKQTAEPAKQTAEPAMTLPSMSAPATPPIDGYDDFSIAQLRGHLRGYAQKTVEELLSYEEAGLSREPYLRMLRNRLERLRSDNRSPADA